jgi:hypothetical protein
VNVNKNCVLFSDKYYKILHVFHVKLRSRFMEIRLTVKSVGTGTCGRTDN